MISVCMATFNGSRFIHEQLESILVQLPPDGEVVVADDGSADDTLDRIEAFDDPRIRILEVARLGSPSRTFERALSAARGTFIFLSDQDDVWLPGRLDTAMNLHDRYGVVVVDCMLIDEDGAILSAASIQQGRSGLVPNLWRNRFIGCCMSVSRGVLDAALPFPAGIPAHDSWLGLIGEATSTTCFYSKVLVKYRRHSKNLSPAGRPSPHGRVTQLRHRTSLAWNLAGRMVTRSKAGRRE